MEDVVSSEAFLDRWRPEVEQALTAAIREARPAELAQAMRYAVLGPGKRLRPLLALAACAACGGDPASVLPAAVALELVHAFSLVHDDLPCMDDDDFRRGRLTCHKVFGEAMALLAGDAILALALELLASCQAPWAMDATRVLAASVARGLVPGQVMDIELQHQSKGPADIDLAEVHRLKTGQLFRACCLIGGLAAQASPARLEALGCFADHFGLAFQIADDLQDAVRAGTADKAAAREFGYPSLHGLAIAQTLCRQEQASALEALASFGPEADHLRLIASTYIRFEIPRP